MRGATDHITKSEVSTLSAIAAARMVVAANAATCASLLRLALSRRPHAVARQQSLPLTSDPLLSLAEARC